MRVETCSWELRPALSVCLFVQPPLALITEKWVSTGRPVSSRHHFTAPVAHAFQPQELTDVPTGLGLALLLRVSSPSSWLPATPPSKPWRPGESKSNERKGLNLALPSNKPANTHTSSGFEFHRGCVSRAWATPAGWVEREMEGLRHW